MLVANIAFRFVCTCILNSVGTKITCIRLCLAGTAAHPFEDLTETALQLHYIKVWPCVFAALSIFQATWITTIGDQSKPPFLRTPALLECLPCDRVHPASFFKLDLFHILLIGVYKDFLGSALVECLALFDASNMEERANQMNASLQVFLQEPEGKKLKLHANALNLTLMGYSASDFACGSWSKAQDSVVLMRFLVWLCDVHQNKFNGSRSLMIIRDAAKAMNEFWGKLHESGVWILGDAAASLVAKGQLFCTLYQKLAILAFEEQRLLYNMVPKVHLFHHVVTVMRLQHAQCGYLWNPLVDSTPLDEDFVGHTARMSRRVASKTVQLRTLQRWKCAALVALKALLVKTCALVVLLVFVFVLGFWAPFWEVPVKAPAYGGRCLSRHLLMDK